MRDDTHRTLQRVASAVPHASDHIWLVGGALRDALLDLPVRDIDLATTLDPLALAQTLGDELNGVIARLGKGTVRVVVPDSGGDVVDISSLHGATIAEDLSLRDFTINALALPLRDVDALARLVSMRDSSGSPAGLPPSLLIDPFGGISDLRGRVLRVVSTESLRRDPGRVVRGARMVARLGLRVDTATALLAREAAPSLRQLSADRIREELTALFSLQAIGPGIRMLQQVDALEYLLGGASPEVARHAADLLARLDDVFHARAGTPALPIAQRLERHVARNVGGTTRLEHMSQQARWTALLASTAPGRSPAESAGAARALARFYRVSQLSTHAAQIVPTLGEALSSEPLELTRVRLLVAEAGGIEAAILALLVAVAGIVAHPSADAGNAAIIRHAEMVLDLALDQPQVLNPAPLLTGRDLLALGVTPGERIGSLLQRLRAEQLSGRLESRDDAIRQVRTELRTDA